MEAVAQATPEVVATAESIAKAPKGPKQKHTFMLHSPETFASLGKYISTDARYSALKAASRGVKDILLRKTNSKIIYKYKGDVVTLDTPQIVKRGDREIKYSKKPTVKFVQKFVYQGDLDLEAQDTAAEETENVAV
jgi:hypothetical protein